MLAFIFALGALCGVLIGAALSTRQPPRRPLYATWQAGKSTGEGT